MTCWRFLTTLLAVGLCAIDLVATGLVHRHDHTCPADAPATVCCGHPIGSGQHPASSWEPFAACLGDQSAAPQRPSPHSLPGSSDEDKADCTICRHLGQPAAPLVFFHWPALPEPAGRLADRLAPQQAILFAASPWARGPPRTYHAATA
jgi:hypothetical protein